MYFKEFDLEFLTLLFVLNFFAKNFLQLSLKKCLCHYMNLFFRTILATNIVPFKKIGRFRKKLRI